jgi:TctA family transporter
MESLSGLVYGLGIALEPTNLLYCFLGALIGTLIGVLPGLGPAATMAMLLPITYYLDPVAAIIMLTGIYYGAQYGGSTTAILINMPGENSSVIACLDGYQMAKQGRAGAALAVAALASLFAGMCATFVIALFAPPLSKMVLSFGPTEYVSLMVLGLTALIVLAQGSILLALAMIVLGLLLSTIGTDVATGESRLTFGISELFDGIEFVPIAMGLFAVTEIVKNLESPEARSVVTQKIERLWPTRADFRRGFPAAARGTALGSVLGLLPGGGSILSCFASYALEKRISRTPEEFGKGAVEGLAGPEAANNAGAQTSMIPLLTLGIPSNVVMALVAGAMIIQGITPGPQILTEHPAMFWGVIASMLIGNAMLVVINLPLIQIWVKLLKIPYSLFYPAILVFACIGVFSVANSSSDLYVLIVFGLLGYLLSKWGCEATPLMLAFVLGPMMEENFRRAMQLSRGDALVFITHPISAVLLLLSMGLLVLAVLPSIRTRRDEAFKEG